MMSTSTNKIIVILVILLIILVVAVGSLLWFRPALNSITNDPTALSSAELKTITQSLTIKKSPFFPPVDTTEAQRINNSLKPMPAKPTSSIPALGANEEQKIKASLK